MTSNWLVRCLAAAALCLGSGAVLADDLPYKDGPVTDVTSVRTKPGKYFEYLTWLGTHFKVEMEEAKKAGIVVSYAVFSATPRSPHDPDLYLVTTYPNFATFDTIDEKMSAIDKKLWGASPQKMDQQSGERDSIREILGDQIIRELILK